MTDKQKAYIALFSFSAFAASSYIMSRLVLVEHHNHVIGWYAVIVAFIFFVVIKRRFFISLKTVYMPHILFFGMSTTVIPYLILEGSRTVTPSLASSIVVSNALFIALFSRLLGRKKFSYIQMGALIIGFLGVVFVLYDQGSLSGKLYGVLSLLAAAILIAICTVLFEPVVKNLGAAESTRRAFFIAAIIALFLLILVGDYGQLSSPSLIIAGGCFGVFGLAMPVLLFNIGMEFVGATDAATFKMMIPLFALAYGVIIFFELPGLVATFAAAIILIALFIYHRYPLQE
ncbi:MAG: DMT family transporter [Nitrospinota bacterium]